MNLLTVRIINFVHCSSFILLKLLKALKKKMLPKILDMELVEHFSGNIEVGLICKSPLLGIMTYLNKFLWELKYVSPEIDDL